MPWAFTFWAFGPELSIHHSEEHLLAESVIKAILQDDRLSDDVPVFEGAVVDRGENAIDVDSRDDDTVGVRRGSRSVQCQ